MLAFTSKSDPISSLIEILWCSFSQDEGNSPQGAHRAMQGVAPPKLHPPDPKLLTSWKVQALCLFRPFQMPCVPLPQRLICRQACFLTAKCSSLLCLHLNATSPGKPSRNLILKYVIYPMFWSLFHPWLAPEFSPKYVWITCLMIYSLPPFLALLKGTWKQGTKSGSFAAGSPAVCMVLSSEQGPSDLLVYRWMSTCCWNIFKLFHLFYFFAYFNPSPISPILLPPPWVFLNCLFINFAVWGMRVLTDLQELFIVQISTLCCHLW